MTAKQKILRVAESFVGVPYVFGGQSYAGIDCSGMVCKCLQAANIMKFGDDRSADALWKMFRHYTCSSPTPGCLVFWFKEDNACHVGVYVSEGMCISATGIDEQCKYVQYHPETYRFERFAYVDLHD